jgi:phytoene synthase
MSNRLSYVAQEVRRFDRERFVTALFAPSDRREGLFALYAFNLEVARVREAVNEPMLGRMRLQWWRETIGGLFDGDRPAHPVAEALSRVIGPRHLSRWPFDRLLDSRERDMADQPPSDMAALEAYAEGTAATLNGLALEVLGVLDDRAYRAARHVGIAWALTGLLRAVPFHAAAGRLYLPSSLLDRQGVSVQEVLAGKGSPGLVKIAEAMAERARHHLAQARTYCGEMERAALPALLTAPLAETYLDQLRRAGGNPMDTGWSQTRPRPAKLAWLNWRGRY